MDLTNRSSHLQAFTLYLPILASLLFSLSCGTSQTNDPGSDDAGSSSSEVFIPGDGGYPTDASSPHSGDESSSTAPASSSWGPGDPAGITSETRTHTETASDSSFSPKFPDDTWGQSSSPTADPSFSSPDGASTPSGSSMATDSGPSDSTATEPSSSTSEPSSVPPDDTWPTGEGLYAKLVLLLKMNEEQFSSDGLVADSSGRGNDASPQGTVTSTPHGRFGNGAEFDGSGWLTIPDARSLRATSALTLSAWVRFSPLAPDAAPGVIAKRRGFGQDSAYTLFLWEGNRAFVDVDYEDDRFGSSQALEPGVWYHLVVVFDGKRPAPERVKLYINGVLDTVAHESSSTLPATDTAIEVGRLVNGGNTFVGTIDEVAIWTRALSTEEVHTLSETELEAP